MVRTLMKNYIIVSFFIFLSSIVFSQEKTMPDSGYLLLINNDFSIWWIEGTYKVFKEQKIPTTKSKSIKISCAKNEYEPFQLVINSKKDLDNVKIILSDMKNKKGGIVKKENIEISFVEYVKIETPTDSIGHKGLWPDPLPPYAEPFSATKNENKPLWLTVYIPDNTVAGKYNGEIKIIFDDKKKITIPIEISVFNFNLSDETHTKTAYGVGLNEKYHKVESLEDKRKVYDLYLQNFKKHRISPYNPMAFYPIKEEVKCDTEEINFDFSEFDEGAKKYLDEFKFNGFRWGIPGSLCGHRHFDPEFNRLYKKFYRRMFEHFKEKDWLKKAYFYWTDEPQPDSWNHVKEGMKLLKETHPELRRLLTLHVDFSPHPSFYGYVDIWVPIFHFYHPKRAKLRQKKGEEVWWYVCTGPKAPWPNNFTDHPAMNHRIRFWMMQKFNVDGDLYWSTTYWRNNPWEVTMSLDSSGYMFGNGDGSLLYPPSKNIPDKPLIQGPVNSIRFEMIREGLEDKEYFWILEQEIKRLKEKNEKKYEKYINKGIETLRLVNTLVTDLLTFEKDPQKLYLVRERIANVIEELKKIK